MKPIPSTILSWSKYILCAILIAGFLISAVGWYLWRNGALLIEAQNGCLTISRKADMPDTYYRVFDSDEFRIKHGLTLGGRSIEKPYHIDLTLQVPFTMLGKSKLVVAIPKGVNVGEPLEAFQKLIVLPLKGSKATEMLIVKDLRGRVEIRSPKEALAFCRLLTSPATYYYLDCPGVEVVSKKQADIDFFFGSKEALSQWGAGNCNGMMGIVNSDSDLKSLGISPTSVRQKGNCYEIRRTLLTEEAPIFGQRWFVDVVEAVEKDGSYSRKTIHERRVPRSTKYSFIIFHPM